MTDRHFGESFAPVTALLGEAERLAAGHAPQPLRGQYVAFLAFDGVLARVTLAAREPLPAQIRLAWWREAIAALPARREHPALEALASAWRGETDCLGGVIDAWERVVVEGDALATAAEEVALTRAAAIAAISGRPKIEALAPARAWTLEGLAPLAGSPEDRAAMLAGAGNLTLPRLARSLRPLAILGGLAQRAARRGGGPLLGDRLSPLAAIRLGIFGR